ncbi:MAG: phospholipase [Bacteroidia bacterium]|nr:phospholipase [Bacteroidia bacterium]MDW8159068.1 phospholipase [Bacteroidia bacterium]
MYYEERKFDIQEHFFKVQRTASYYTAGYLNEKTQEVWIVLHGYGQLARFFIKHFEPLFSSHRFIVAPEALSRFYLDAQYDRVGASWMTKENRLLEIQDYNNYLENLITSLIQGIDLNLVSINLLGFSQGAATMWRFLNYTQLRIDNVIIWAGIIPAEYQKLHNQNPFSLIAVLGKKDPYITPERKKIFQQVIQDSGRNWLLIEFDGAHTIAPEPLLEVAALVRNKTNVI